MAPQTFILGREARGLYPFRLVGGAIGQLFGRDLRGENGLMLWRPKDALALGGAMELILRRPEPLVVGALLRARDVGKRPVEIVMLPLTGPGGTADRYLCLLQPLASLLPIPDGIATGLDLTNLETNGAPPILRLAAAFGRAV